MPRADDATRSTVSRGFSPRELRELRAKYGSLQKAAEADPELAEQLVAHRADERAAARDPDGPVSAAGPRRATAVGTAVGTDGANGVS